MKSAVKPPCCVPGCKNQNAKRHTIPTKSKYRDIWLQKIYNEKLFNLDDKQLKNYKVCDIHFTDTCKEAFGKLKPNVLPTLHLPVSQRQIKRKKCRVPGINIFLYTMFSKLKAIINEMEEKNLTTRQMILCLLRNFGKLRFLTKINKRTLTIVERKVQSIQREAFTSKYDLTVQEILKKLVKRKHKCGQCERSFKLRSLLVKHNLKNHPRSIEVSQQRRDTIPNVNVCEICHYDFTGEEIAIHISTYFVKPFKCCSRTFFSEREYKKHLPYCEVVKALCLSYVEEYDDDEEEIDIPVKALKRTV